MKAALEPVGHDTCLSGCEFMEATLEPVGMKGA